MWFDLQGANLSQVHGKPGTTVTPRGRSTRWLESYTSIPKPLLLGPWSCDPSTNHTRQFFLPNTHQQAHPPRRTRHKRNTQPRQQKEWHTNVLLLARRPAPVDSLSPSFIIRKDSPGAPARIAICFATRLLKGGAVA